MILAHRYSYELHFGKIPDGLCVCHHCDNPSCVNPKHLFLGTHKDNMQDSFKKNRMTINCGDNHGNSKLKSEQIKEIRSKYVPYKYSTCKLAREYNVSQANIFDIVMNKSWKHIDGKK